MDVRTKNSLKKSIVNIVGAFGYFFCSMQWLWAIMLNFSLIRAILLFFSPNFDNQVARPASVADLGSNPIFIAIAVLTTVVMVLATIYVLIKMPSTIVKTSKKAVHETASNVTPLILRIQHKKDTKRNYIKLTPRIILLIKTILIIAPVLLIFTPQSIDNQMISHSMAVYVGFCLACMSGVFFAIQYLLAGLLEVKKQYLW